MSSTPYAPEAFSVGISLISATGHPEYRLLAGLGESNRRPILQRRDGHGFDWSPVDPADEPELVAALTAAHEAACEAILTTDVTA